MSNEIISDEDIVRNKFYEYFTHHNKKNEFEEALQKMNSISNQFYINLKIPEYAPEEVVVTVQGNGIEVKGKHEEKNENGEPQVLKSFVKTFNIPPDCDITQLSSNFSVDGILTVSAPRSLKETERRNRKKSLQDRH